MALHVRRGVAEYIPVPADYYRESDILLKLDSETWAGLYLSDIDLVAALAEARIGLVNGEEREAIEVFDLFDRFVPFRNYKVPPLED